MHEMCFQSDKAHIKIVDDLEHKNSLKNEDDLKKKRT